MANLTFQISTINIFSGECNGKKRRFFLQQLIVFIFTCSSRLHAAEDKNQNKKEPSENKPSAIDVSAEVDNNHPSISPGLSCNDCHKMKLDVETMATQTWINGKMPGKHVNEGVMPLDQIWEYFVKTIGTDKKDTKTFVIGTSMNNKPLTTTSEFALNPDKKVLYGFHEQGTEKLFHIKNNPCVSINYHEEFDSFDAFLCCQILGRAKLIDGTNPEFEQIPINFLPYEDGARIPKNYSPNQRAEHLKLFRQGIKKGFYISKITIDRITIIDICFVAKGFRRVQRWVRR
jgi:hypothetical protein